MKRPNKARDGVNPPVKRKRGRPRKFTTMPPWEVAGVPRSTYYWRELQKKRDKIKAMEPK